MRWTTIALLSLSVACTKKEASAPPEPEQVAESEAPVTAEAPPGETEAAAALTADEPELPEELKRETPAIGAPPTVNVLDRGQEPRRALRWNVQPGFEQKVSASVASSIEALIAVMMVRAPLYAVSYELTLRATSLADNGSLRVGITVDRATADLKAVGDAERAKQIETALGTLGKVGGRYTLGPRGQVTDVQLDVPPEAAGVAREMIDNLGWAIVEMTPVFPAEPIGQGAKWTVHQGIEQGGATVNQLATIELVKLEGNRVELGLDIRQSAAPQSFENAGTMRTLDLTVLKGLATGSLTWDLGELAPRNARIDAETVKGVRHAPPKPSEKPVSSVIMTKRTVEIAAKR
ncbi:MAG: hypothetical protein WBM46_07280 [Polyangiales bacterium]